MSLTIEYLPEPHLQFGSNFEHPDAKTGLAEFGPFGKNLDGVHPSEIRVGFVGTPESITTAKLWLEECARPIASQNIQVERRRQGAEQDMFGADLPQRQALVRLDKILNRDFVGFNLESPFACRFQINERWDRELHHREVERLLADADEARRISSLVDLIDSEVQSIATTAPAPDVIVVALTTEMMERASVVRLTGNIYLNLRRAIKARAMQWGVPIQIVRQDTAAGTRANMQEKATRAWNFCTAMYYKKDGIPWRPLALQRDTCYVGVSFYIAQDLTDTITMRSSVVQAFDHLGQGLVLRGDPFEWDTQKSGRAPHLTQAAARKLIAETLRAYTQINKTPPRRVVIHKTSIFWGAEHDEYNEREGFFEGIEDIFPRIDSDLVSLRQTGVYLFREGIYPPLRGTYVTVGDAHFLYTMGYIPYLETYPGSYVPEPWQLVDHHGGTAPRDLFREILALTKMNVNNCTFADGAPITLLFAKRVGDIMKHIPEHGVVRPQYKFYM